MSTRSQWIGFVTIMRKEIHRVFRIWSQTLLPPAITTTLYFLIFGHVIGPRIGVMAGYDYVTFIAPGLIMMTMITSSYQSTVSSFYSAKFMRNIDELLVSPMSNAVILLGFLSGGITRGFMVGLIVGIIAACFTHLHLYSWFVMLTVTVLASSIFSLAGLINAVFARSFDDISIIPTFVLTPLTYLGGVFYSISILPKVWQYISYANPIVYIIGTFRYGLLGLQDPFLLGSFLMMFLFLIGLFGLAWYLLSVSIGLRS